MTQVHDPQVTEAIPFLTVSDMRRSLAFYQDGLGFEIELVWRPEGEIRWCQIRLGKAALMLQEAMAGQGPDEAAKAGHGVPIMLMCKDALAAYHLGIEKGLAPEMPFVGNGLWVTSYTDPDGYRLDFESPTDVAEETVYQP